MELLFESGSPRVSEGESGEAVERDAAETPGSSETDRQSGLEEADGAARPRLLWTGLAAGIVLILAAAVLYRYFRPEFIPLAGNPGEVVLGGFANRTGDDSYDGLERVLRVKLEESPYLNLAPAGSLSRVVSESRAASPQQLAKVCASLGGRVLIDGAIVARTRGYEVTTAAHNCSNGKVLTRQTVKAANRESVLAALDQATDQLRKSLGESGDSLLKFNMPLAQATTSSLAALRAFTLGEEKRDKGQEFEAIQDYKLAVDLDPQFAMAYARLGTIYSNAAELTLSARYFQKAFDLREHTTDRERLYIAAHYYSASGQVQREIEAYELWRSLYPRDSSPNENLAIEYLALGAPQKAAAPASASAQLDAASSLSQAVLARVYLETGEHEQLRALCNQAPGSEVDSAMLHESCFLLAFLHNDEAGMEKQSRWSRGNAAESELLDDVAWVAMYQGKLASGRKIFAQARKLALAQGFSELAATIDADEAMLKAEYAYPREARALALDALRLAPDNVRIEASAGLALARAGDAPLAQATAAKASAQAPLDTILHQAELPTITAAIEIHRRNPQAAIQALEAARPYDRCSALALAPAYYRGLAYQAAEKPELAAHEFRSVLEHRALVPDSPFVPLAALRLARVLQQTGNSAGAAKAQDQVAGAWKRADPDFLPLRQLHGPGASGLRGATESGP